MPAVDLHTPVMTAEGLCVALGGMPVLRDVDVRVDAGKTVALVGGNGSGKSTTVRAMLGLVAHQRGDATLFGTPIEQFRDWHRVGYVPQRGALTGTNATVGEVVASGRLARRRLLRPLSSTDKEAITVALEDVDLLDRRRWPITKLSGGQQQRALIARALAGRPDVLVLDEPMAGIDLETQQRLAGLFAMLKQRGLTMMVVLHELGPMADLIDTTIVLRDGRVIDSQPDHEGAHCDPDDESGPLGLTDPLTGAR